MRRFRSLRFRVAFIFAWFGALVSLILAVSIYFAAHKLGNRLMDDTLRAEMEDYTARRKRNPRSLPPSTLSLRGFVTSANETETIPPELLRISAQDHPTLFNVTLEEIPYRAIMVIQGDETFYLLFNTKSHRDREEDFFNTLLFAALLIALLAAGGGWKIAFAITAPVTQLAAQVAESAPEGTPPVFDSEYRQDEVGELARAFSLHLTRLRAFIYRERAFTADVSHELRTPLAVIQGATEVMQSDPALSEKQRQRLDRIERSAREMAALISALLILAREENVHNTPDRECSMMEVVEEALEKVRPMLQGKQVSLEVEILAQPILDAAKTLAGVVVGNLIRNAVHHTKEGIISIKLDQERLVVSDTGEGIPKEDLQFIFKHYFRGSTSTGHGIGLSLVRRICDLYGWDIQVESAPGQGTVVRFLFATALHSASETHHYPSS